MLIICNENNTITLGIYHSLIGTKDNYVAYIGNISIPSIWAGC